MKDLILEETSLYLCSGVDLDPNYEFSIDFDTPELQRAYFDTKRVNIVDSENYSQITSDTICVDIPIENLRRSGANYLYFNSNQIKVYYAFITSLEWASDSSTYIHFEIDVMQTYLFNHELKESFVEREHQDRWRRRIFPTEEIVPVYNKQREDINYGDEYDIQADNVPIVPVKLINGDDSELIFIYAYLNKPINNSSSFIDCNVPTGQQVVMGVAIDSIDSWVIAKRVYWKNTETPFTDFASMIEEFNKLPAVTQIVISKIPPVPLKVTTVDNGYVVDVDKFNVTSDTFEFKLYQMPKDVPASYMIDLVARAGSELYNRAQEVDIELGEIMTPPSSINTLRNVSCETKLFTFPYNFTKILYGNGEVVIKREYSGDKQILFAYQSLSNDATAYIALSGYLSNDIVNNMHSISNQVPSYADLATDAWLNYMMQNKAQRTAGFVNEAVGIGAGLISSFKAGAFGLATGLSMAAGSFTRINSQLAKEKDIKNQPNDIKQFNGDTGLTRVTTNLGIKQLRYDVVDDYKKILFNYFTHYGYKCNDFKKPNLKSRYYYNYIKTADCKISSTADAEVIKKLKDIYNDGITLWHWRDADTFKGINNYDYENVEMSLMEVIA